MESCRRVVFVDCVEQDLACLGDAAADDDHVGIDDAGDVRNCFAEHLADFLDDREGHLVASLRVVKNVLGRKRIQRAERRVCAEVSGERTFCQSHYAGRGAVLLQAPLLAAAAGLRLVVANLHMADLTGCAVGAGQDFAIQNDAAAYARTEGDHDNIGMALAAAVPLLAERCDVGVVTDLDRYAAQKRGELAAHIKDAPTEIDALVDDAVCQNGSGNADADAFEIVEGEILLIKLLGDCASDIRKDHLAVAFLAGGNFPVIEELALGCKKSDLNSCAANVDTKCIWFHNDVLPPNPLFYQCDSAAFARMHTVKQNL